MALLLNNWTIKVTDQIWTINYSTAGCQIALLIYEFTHDYFPAQLRYSGEAQAGILDADFFKKGFYFMLIGTYQSPDRLRDPRQRGCRRKNIAAK